MYACLIENEHGDGCDYDPIGLFWGLVAGRAVLGALATHRTPEQVLFQSGGLGASAVDFSLSPVLSKERKGALFSMTW